MEFANLGHILFLRNPEGFDVGYYNSESKLYKVVLSSMRF